MVKIEKYPYLGIFGFSFEEKVADFMIDDLGKNQSSILKDFWQAGGKNVTLVKNLSREYLALQARGSRPSDFSTGTYDSNTYDTALKMSNALNVPINITVSFLKSIFYLASQGKIEYSKWNPRGYEVSRDLQKSFESEKDIIEKLKVGVPRTLIVGIALSVPILYLIIRKQV